MKSITAAVVGAFCFCLFLLPVQSARAADGDVKWLQDFPELMEGLIQPIIMDVVQAKNGLIIVTIVTDYMVALDPVTGEKRWTTSIKRCYSTNICDARIVIAEDGTILITTIERLLAIDPDNGSIKWIVDLPSGGHFTTVALGADGTIYLGAGSKLVAISHTTHAILWTYDMGENIQAPAIGADSTIYVTSGKDLVAFDPATRSEKWRFTAESVIPSSPVAGFHGQVYFATYSTLYSIKADGTEKWSQALPMLCLSAPTVGPDGTIYVPLKPMTFGGLSFAGGALMAFSPNGRVKWTFHIDFWYVYVAPLIGDDGTIYLSAEGRVLYALDSYGRLLWERETIYGGWYHSGMTISSDGTLYATFRYYIVAFESSSRGVPANAPWPVVAHDLTHSNRNDVSVPPCEAPVITAEPENQLVDPGQSVTFTVSTLGNTPMDFQWYNGLTGDTSEPAGTGSTFTTPALSKSESYWARITNSCGETFTRGVTAAVGIPGQRKWFVEVDEEVNTTPAIAEDGTIYVVTDAPSLYAISPDGQEKWKFDLRYMPEGESIYSRYNYSQSTPTIGPDGTIFVASYSQYPQWKNCKNYAVVWAISPDGTKRWTFVVTDTCASGHIFIESSPALGRDGTIFIADRSGDLYAISPEGRLKWKFAPESYFRTGLSPAVGKDGTIYYTVQSLNPGTANAWHLIAVNPTGTEKWTFDMGGLIANEPTPVIGEDGTIYISGDDGYFYALTPEGVPKWHFYGGGAPIPIPAIGEDNTIYLGVHVNYYALDPATGAVKWKSADHGGAPAGSSPVVGKDGIVYGTTGYEITAFSPVDGSEQWSTTVGSHDCSSPVIAQDGTLYVGTGMCGNTNVYRGYVFALITGSLGVADSPWPVEGQNVYHSQRVKDAELICEEPVIVVQPQDVTVEHGQNATLTAEAAGTAPFFVWYQGEPGGNSTPAGSGSSLTIPAPAASTTFWVQVSNMCGEATSDTAMVTVVNGDCTPPAITAQPENQTISPGQNALLEVNATGTQPLTYQWYRGQSGDTTAPVGTNSSSYLTPDLTETASYWVRITNQCGNATSSTATITVSGPVSDDGDGVPASVEDNAPNAGDANRDGTPDRLQSNVASVPAATGNGYVTVVLSGCTQLQNVKTMAEGNNPPPDDPGFIYPYGLIGFDIPCAQGTVTVYFHQARSLSGTIYRKYGPRPPSFSVPEWYTLEDVQTGSDAVGPFVKFTLLDGRLGDDTPQDGRISDQGGPAVQQTSVLVPTITTLGAAVMATLMILTVALFRRRSVRGD